MWFSTRPSPKKLQKALVEVPPILTDAASAADKLQQLYEQLGVTDQRQAVLSIFIMHRHSSSSAEEEPHRKAVEYARAFVMPNYHNNEEGTPWERGQCRQIAQHWLAGYFTAKGIDT